MLRVGVTGGIGSGKSVVCQVFETLGIPVFEADTAARYLMEHDKGLVAQISALVGEEVYRNGILDRSKLSSIIFGNSGKREALNAFVHPATIAYGKRWMKDQQSPYSIKEAAIFFESGSNTDIDVMLGVYAPEELRIGRVMKRSGYSREKVLAIIASQMNEEEKMKQCDFVITNDDAQAVLPQVLNIHQQLLKKANAA